MMNDDYIVTELNQQTGMEDSECYYLLGIKERHNGKWNWIRHVQKKINCRRQSTRPQGKQSSGMVCQKTQRLHTRR